MAATFISLPNTLRKPKRIVVASERKTGVLWRVLCTQSRKRLGMENARGRNGHFEVEWHVIGLREHLCNALAW